MSYTVEAGKKREIPRRNTKSILNWQLGRRGRRWKAIVWMIFRILAADRFGQKTGRLTRMALE